MVHIVQYVSKELDSQQAVNMRAIHASLLDVVYVVAAASTLQWKCGLSLGKQTTMIQSVSSVSLLLPMVMMAVMPSKLSFSYQ